MDLAERSAVILKPSQLFLDWLNNALAKESSQLILTLPQLQANCRVFLVPEVNEPEAAMSFISEYYEQLFALELGSWFESAEYWPSPRDLDTFWKFFEVEVSEEVIDLLENSIHNPIIMD